MTRESPDGQTIQKDMMFVASAFNPGIADLDPIAFDASFSFERFGGILSPQCIGGMGCRRFFHPSAIARLEVERKMLLRGRAGFEFLGNLMRVVALP